MLWTCFNVLKVAAVAVSEDAEYKGLIHWNDAWCFDQPYMYVRGDKQ